MHAPLVITALLLFASMFVPLPSPVGLAISLWALGEGVPLPAVLILYVTQDLLTYTALGRLLPRLSRRLSPRTGSLTSHLPLRLRRAFGVLLSPAAPGGASLFSAALLSFYAGAALATLQKSAPVRSAAIVIGTDVARYVNGLAVALGASFLLPSSPLTPVAASLLGLVAIVLFRTISGRVYVTRDARVLVPARTR